jgi:DNA-binding response OmpR family regulator
MVASKEAHMNKQVILVIEDDEPIRRGIVDLLEIEGFSVQESGDGLEGSRMAEQVECDLILLDLALPNKDGLEILQAVRGTRPTMPVIILTARGSEEERVRGLKLGADDYVVKPFSPKELLARIEAVMRRTPERPTDVQTINFNVGTIDLERREVRLHDGGRHDLSEREVELVRYLATNRGRAISRDELLARVWRMDPKGVATRTIDMHIARLREKLNEDPTTPRTILTVRGKGYMLQDIEPCQPEAG